MKKSKAAAATLIAAMILMISAMGLASSAARAAHIPTVNLGTAAPFAILAGTGITNVPTSVISGSIGVSPTTGASITGFACPEVSGGSIYTVDAAGPTCRVEDPGLLGTAKTALTAAYTDAAGRTGGVAVNPDPLFPNELNGQTLTHGIYTSGGAMTLAPGGTLTLNGQGDPNAVFIFQLNDGASGVLTVNNATTINLINQAQPCNVFWKVYAADIGSTAAFKGTVLASTSITVGANSTVQGRLLANTGNVTLIMDTIIRPTSCATSVAPVPPTMPPFTIAPSATPAATATPIGTSAPTATPIGGATPAVAPTSTPGTGATPAVAVAQMLPSTSTNDPSSPLLMLGFGLVGIGSFVLRRHIRRA
jgi:hypothetical protein